MSFFSLEYVRRHTVGRSQDARSGRRDMVLTIPAVSASKVFLFVRDQSTDWDWPAAIRANQVTAARFDADPDALRAAVACRPGDYAYAFLTLEQVYWQTADLPTVRRINFRGRDGNLRKGSMPYGPALFLPPSRRPVPWK